MLLGVMESYPGNTSAIIARHRPPEADSGEAGGRNPKSTICNLKSTIYLPPTPPWW
jgi:hypothetical protein